MIKKTIFLSLILLLQVLSLVSCNKYKKNSLSQNSDLPKVQNSAAIPTYVFYYATWCGFCHKMAPNVQKAANEYINKIHFHFVDIDSEEGKKFTAKYRPKGRGVPFAQYYDAQGNMVDSEVGLMSYEELQKSLEQLI